MKQEVYTDYENIKEFAPVPQSSDGEYYMHDWVFHFNPYTSLWCAVPRELYNKYWDDSQLENVLRSKDISTLLYLLHRSKGDINEIHKITSTK